jgi:hypothetical protein
MRHFDLSFPLRFDDAVEKYAKQFHRDCPGTTAEEHLLRKHFEADWTRFSAECEAVGVDPDEIFEAVAELVDKQRADVVLDKDGLFRLEHLEQDGTDIVINPDKAALQEILDVSECALAVCIGDDIVVSADHGHFWDLIGKAIEDHLVSTDGGRHRHIVITAERAPAWGPECYPVKFGDRTLCISIPNNKVAGDRWIPIDEEDLPAALLRTLKLGAWSVPARSRKKRVAA